MFKSIILVSILMTSVYTYEVPAIATQHQNTYRTFGNLGQVSTYSKTLDTPFSTVRKADVRISNPGFAVHAPYAHATYAAPAIAHAAYPAPAFAHGPIVAPVAKAVAPAGLLGVAYSPATAVSHMTYTNGLGLSYAW